MLHPSITLAVTVALLAISGFSAGTDIYKQEIGCRLATPGLQGKVNEADRKQKELVALKDKINLAWGPGKIHVLGKMSWRVLDSIYVSFEDHVSHLCVLAYFI